MIYLIGGPPRCGKTTVAKRIAKETGASILHGDWVESVVSRYIPQSIKTQLFPKNDIRRQTAQSNDVMYAQYTADQIVTAYVLQADTSRPAIDEFIRRAVSADSDLVIEGFQVSPSVMYETIALYGPEKITTRMLVRNVQQGIVDDCRKSEAQNDWFLEKSSNPDTHFLIAQMIIHYSVLLSSEADEHGLPVEYMDHGFFDAIERVTNTLLSDGTETKPSF